MDKSDHSMFANISFQNVGAKGKLSAFGNGILVPSSTKSSEARKQLQESIKRGVSKGGDMTYSIGAQEKKWFTVPGPKFTPEQDIQIKKGDLAFYFGVTIISDSGEHFDYCSFIIGAHIETVLLCEE
jgi:hypothetical protein